MTAEVDWVLDTIVENWPGDFYAAPVERVDRDESKLLEGDIRSRTEDLEKSNYVGATHADTLTSPVGTEYDHELETIVGVRLEGLTAHNGHFGHVDPTGSDGIPWSEFVQNVRRGLLAERSYPDVGRIHRDYTDLRITNEASQSENYRDYYRTDFDVVLGGYEELP